MRWWRTFFSPRRFERSGRFHERLGVRVFLRLTPFALSGRLRGTPIRVLTGPASARRYFRSTVAGERAHLLSGVFLLGCAGWLLAAGEALSVGLLTAANILVNLYPVLLMRWNRVRVARALGRDPAELLDDLFPPRERSVLRDGGTEEEGRPRSG